MDRRTVLALAGAVIAAPRALLAQPVKRTYRIAILDDAVESTRAEMWKLFRNRLRELGLVEGKNVVYEMRYARGDTERLPALGAELVALKPDIIVTVGTPPTSALIKATSSIPIVFINAGDPVGSGLVASLARPGGNVTGISIITPQIAGKQLEMLRELSPAAIRLAYLTDASNKSSVAVFRQIEEHARAMNVTIRMLIRGADYVFRILQGAKPASLPVEQSSNLRMVLNLKTARTLGIKIPESVRLRANEVIE